MRRVLSCFASVLAVPVLALTQGASGGKFEIAGNIRGLGSDSVVLFVSQYSAEGKRTGADTLATQAVNNRFHLKGGVSRPRFVWAQLGGLKSRKNFSFFLEKGEISIKGSADSVENLTVTGTPSNNEMTATRKLTNDIYERIKAERVMLKNYDETSADYKRIMTVIGAKFDSIQTHELAYIKAHPASQVSAIYLYVKQDKLPVEELETLYNSLSEDVRQNDMVSMIPGKISAKRSVAVGNIAPDFSSFDTSGKTVKLSDFKGKYVLLEFWASWCMPCRKQSPHMIEMHKKYAARGFDILQYSLDDSNAAARWKQAIRKDGLYWTQVSDLDGMESKVAKAYGVQPIPDNFLIDPSGKIIARGIMGDQLENKLKQVLR